MLLCRVFLSLVFVSFFSIAEQFEGNLLIYKNFEVDGSEIESAIISNNRNIDDENQNSDERLHINRLFLNKLIFDSGDSLTAEGSISNNILSQQPLNTYLNWKIVKSSDGQTIKSDKIFFRNLIGEKDFRFSSTLAYGLFGDFTISATAKDNLGVESNTVSIPFYVNAPKIEPKIVIIHYYVAGYPDSLFARVKVRPKDPELTNFCSGITYTASDNATGNPLPNSRITCHDSGQIAHYDLPLEDDVVTYKGVARIGDLVTEALHTHPR